MASERVELELEHSSLRDKKREFRARRELFSGPDNWGKKAAAGASNTEETSNLWQQRQTEEEVTEKHSLESKHAGRLEKDRGREARAADRQSEALALEPGGGGG